MLFITGERNSKRCNSKPKILLFNEPHKIDINISVQNLVYHTTLETLAVFLQFEFFFVEIFFDENQSIVISFIFTICFICQKLYGGQLKNTVIYSTNSFANSNWRNTARVTPFRENVLVHHTSTIQLYWIEMKQFIFTFSFSPSFSYEG
jgi:hypothetical protein